MGASPPVECAWRTGAGLLAIRERGYPSRRSLVSIRLTTSCFALVTLALTALPCHAQSTGSQQIVAPRIDLVGARQGGMPRIRMLVDKQWITLPSGTFRNPDGAAITVEDGVIRSVAHPGARRGPFVVSKIDAVSLRANFDSPRLVLGDAAGRTSSLPDGRFTNDQGVTLVVRDGTIAGFSSGR